MVPGYCAIARPVPFPDFAVAGFLCHYCADLRRQNSVMDPGMSKSIPTLMQLADDIRGTSSLESTDSVRQTRTDRTC